MAREAMKTKWYQSHFIEALAVSGLFVLLYAFFLARLDLFKTLQFSLEDSVAKIVYNQQPLLHSAEDLVLVTIDNEDFKQIRKWPWPRSLFAEFLEKLTTYRPKAVFFDIVFHGSSPSGPEDDAVFEEAIRKAGNVVLASFFDKDWNYQVPYEKFGEASFAFGFVNKPRDLDLVVRRARILVFGRERSVIDLSAEIKTVCRYLDVPLEELYLHERDVELRPAQGPSILIPISDDGTTPINFLISKGEITRVPFWRVLQNKIPRNKIEGKIVLVSITSEAFHDQFTTPTHEDQPGAVIGGNIIEMILKQKFLTKIPQEWVWGFSFALGLAVSVLALRYSFLVGLLFLVLVASGVFSGAVMLRLREIQSDSFSPLFISGVLFVGVSVYNYFKLVLRNAGLRQLAITDGLTGMYIYRYLVVHLKSELDRAQRYGVELSFIIADIDHFKHFNDTYGHDQGNIVLKNFAKIVRENCRKSDFPARYGGEEFCVLLPHTPQDKAVQFAEKLRKAIEVFPFPGQKEPLHVSASFGVSCFHTGQIDTVKKLFTCADAALYRAKETGRNKVCGFDPSQDKMPEEGGEMEGTDFPVQLD